MLLSIRHIPRIQNPQKIPFPTSNLISIWSHDLNHNSTELTPLTFNPNPAHFSATLPFRGATPHRSPCVKTSAGVKIFMLVPVSRKYPAYSHDLVYSVYFFSRRSLTTAQLLKPRRNHLKDCHQRSNVSIFRRENWIHPDTGDDGTDGGAAATAAATGESQRQHQLRSTVQAHLSPGCGPDAAGKRVSAEICRTECDFGLLLPGVVVAREKNKICPKNRPSKKFINVVKKTYDNKYSNPVQLH